jgi:ABC-type nitrate/sulfonate/bicarbonate transport system substrate-binding protein
MMKENTQMNKRTISRVLSMVVLAMLLVVGRSMAAPKEPATVKYILNNLVSVYTTDIALEKGFFEEQGIKIETVGVAGGGSGSLQAVLTGNADIGGAAMPAYINAVKAGGKLKVIYGGPAMAHEKDPGYMWIVRSDSNINSAKDLVGKTIAMGARGGMAEYATKEYLKKNGVPINKLNILVVPNPQHEQVLRSKQVDAIVALSPSYDKILEGGGTKALTTLYNIFGKNIGGAGFGVVVREDLVRKNPELVGRLVSVYVKTDSWARKNPDKARQVVATILKKRKQNPVIAKYWKAPHLRDYGLLNDRDVTYWLDWFVEEGKLKEGEIKPSDIYTNQFNPYFKKL